MKPELEGDVTVMYVRSGLNKKGNPYLQLANGRSEFWCDLPKDTDLSQFDGVNEGELITVTVAQTVGTDRVRFIR